MGCTTSGRRCTATRRTRPLAAEEMIRIATPRADFGWPYCYYDYLKQSRVLAPEYGGDKERTGRCDRLIQPLVPFPAHWAPMSMVFYTGKMFPAAYQGGVFIAFHGSAFRAPLAAGGLPGRLRPVQGRPPRRLHRVREWFRRRHGEPRRRRTSSSGIGPRTRRRALPERRQGRPHLENHLIVNGDRVGTRARRRRSRSRRVSSGRHGAPHSPSTTAADRAAAARAGRSRALCQPPRCSLAETPRASIRSSARITSS